VAMFAFSRAVLKMRMWARDMMGDAYALKESVQFLIFTTQSVCMATILRLNILSTRFESLENAEKPQICDEAYKPK
jgi:hypothetical protein